MQKTRLLHVGYPKCMSSTLQRDLFAKHPEIAFVGWGLPATEHGWIDDNVAAACEVGIRYEKTLSYDAVATREAFASYLQAFEEDTGKKVFCLSSESFSFTMHFDVDPGLKAQRLKDLLGDRTKVLIVIRNQFDLFRSYYFECVRGGYTGYFGDFLDFHYHYFFHSILSDLRYSLLYELYCRLFGKENVRVVAMESMKERSDSILEEICTFSGIERLPFPLTQHNSSEDKQYLQAVRLLNERFAHNQGNTYSGWVYGEKLVPYWRVTRGLAEPQAQRRNYGQQMMVFRAAASTVRDFVDPLDATYPDEWARKMTDLYAEDNAALARATGIDLRTLGYPCV